VQGARLESTGWAGPRGYLITGVGGPFIEALR